MILCNHFAITTTYLHGYLQIYCKKRFFHRKSTPTQNAEIPQLVEQKPCHRCVGNGFCLRCTKTKKVSDFSETSC